MTTRTLRVGDRIRDNDPRMANRVLTVIEFTTVRAWNYGKKSSEPGVVAGDPDKLAGRNRIRLDRIHCDGKPRRSGWSLVE